MKTYLFYDTETTGLNPAFDQVLTFAAIRTDTRLNEISREEIVVKLRPDVVPSPGAFLTHRLTPEVLETGVSEYEAALKIHRLFNTPDTISCGYNSLGFDDEFLRFLFYRNLLDPYAHQFARGCSRMDMLPVTVIYRLFCQNVLSWPSLENGKGTLKLEFISRENGFTTSGRAHEAMSDVEALLALARQFSSEDKIWAYVQTFFDKKKEGRRILSLDEAHLPGNEPFRIGIMVSPAFGVQFNYMAPVLHLGGSIPYKNQSLWLRLDQDDLLSRKDTETGFYDFFVTRKRAGDQLFVLPGLDRFKGRLTPAAKEQCKRNLDAIRENWDLFMETVAFHRQFKYPVIPDLDLDAALYQDGFFSSAEKQDMAQFHAILASGDLTAADQLSSQRLRRMARRVVYRNFPTQVPEEIGFVTHLQRLADQGATGAVTGYKNDSKLTCSEALAQLREIETGANPDEIDSAQAEILKWLKNYIPELSASLAQPF